MKRGTFTLAACLLSALGSPLVGVAQQTAAETTPKYPKAVLSKAFATTLGDMIAQSLATIVTATKGYGDPSTVVVYNRDAQKIAVFVYGSKTTLDGAKKALDTTRTQMHNSAGIIEYVYHQSLDEGAFAYLYFHDGKNVISWEDGKFTVGSE